MTPAHCSTCGAALQEGALVCSRCEALVHRARLEEIAALTGSAGPAEALTLWREALALLPAESRQHAKVLERVRALSEEVDGMGAPAAPAPAPSAKPKRGALATGLAAVGAMALKLKGLLFLVLGKAKLLLLGFGKLGTLLSMFASVSLYTMLWGWKFAVGFVLCTYIHEIGHVAAFRHYGLPASAPMFIPGYGAYVRSTQYPATRREDARIGIAGPLWGAGAALACLLVATLGGGPLFFALARTAAWINLFNLLPIPALDGGHAFRALSQPQRGLSAIAILAAGVVQGDGLSIVVGLAAAGVAMFSKDAPEEGDLYTAAAYTLLGAGLSMLASLQVPT